ncbi:MAG: hypothetical protein ACK4NP_09620 [Parvularculaceae bacterium]
MVLAALWLLAAASYPPTPADAERAVSDRHFGGAPASLDRGRPGGSLAVRLLRCVRQDSYEVQGPFGLIVLDGGHECVLAISRAGAPDYHVRGFFHHDGLDWRYYGPTREPLVAEMTSWGVDGGFSTATPKPGSRLYNRGAPGEAVDPYARIFAGYDWFYAPVGLPPDNNPYTEE